MQKTLTLIRDMYLHCFKIQNYLIGYLILGVNYFYFFLIIVIYLIFCNIVYMPKEKI